MILAEPNVKKHKKREEIEKTIESIWQTHLNRARGASLVENRATAITNAEYQKGKWMTTPVFTARLLKLNPDLSIVPHPNPLDIKYFSTKAAVYLSMPDGNKTLLFPCEGDWMPEWDIFGEMTIRTPLGELQRIPYICIKRGWRTVLMRLIIQKVITLEAAEKEFEAGDRFSWKVMSGKGPGRMPI